MVRVETDNGSGLPSGTLAFANATSATAGTVFTTSYVDTTLTFSGAFTLTDGVVYHIVISRSAGLDVSNYYFVQGISRNTRSFQSSLYNTSYAAYTGTNMIYLSYAGAYSTVAVKTNATNADNVNYVGIAGATKTI